MVARGPLGEVLWDSPREPGDLHHCTLYLSPVFMPLPHSSWPFQAPFGFVVVVVCFITPVIRKDMDVWGKGSHRGTKQKQSNLTWPPSRLGLVKQGWAEAAVHLA